MRCLCGQRSPRDDMQTRGINRDSKYPGTLLDRRPVTLCLFEFQQRKCSLVPTQGLYQASIGKQRKTSRFVTGRLDSFFHITAALSNGGIELPNYSFSTRWDLAACKHFIPCSRIAGLYFGREMGTSPCLPEAALVRKGIEGKKLEVRCCVRSLNGPMELTVIWVTQIGNAELHYIVKPISIITEANPRVYYTTVG